MSELADGIRKKNMKIGIIGTGRIARRFVPEARAVERTEIVAVYNPHIVSAERFAQEQEINFYTDDFDEIGRAHV